MPADLVLMVGVFGNISDKDVRKTVRSLPFLCKPDATVIWTRSRRAPDLTPSVRGWFRDAGFVEVAFEAPPDALFTIGVNRLGSPQPPSTPEAQLFTFTT